MKHITIQPVRKLFKMAILPNIHETILHQVLRFDGIAHEPQRIGDQPRLIIDIQPLEIIPYGPVVHP